MLIGTRILVGGVCGHSAGKAKSVIDCMDAGVACFQVTSMGGRLVLGGRSFFYLDSSLSFGASPRSPLSVLPRLRCWFTLQPRICVGPELGSCAAEPVSLWS